MAHLDIDMGCHPELTKKGDPPWKNAERRLKLVGELVHAIDLHPFASFLTTLNILFMILPLYATVRKQDSDFTIDLHIFSADSLERPDQKTAIQSHLFSQMNSRIQLTADSYERYRKIIDTKFDRVFGNPPWGGVLKGSLAPVYDNAKKEHFTKAFPNAAKGKYDIYGLFIERALQLLKQGGRFAFLTQDTYLDKEWAKGLRGLLATKANLQDIVDLNPFGQLFFRAMNSPCATAAVNIETDANGECLCVTSRPGQKFGQVSVHERREKVVQTVREILNQLSTKKRAEVLFASGARIKYKQLRETANDRWDLSGGVGKQIFPETWFTAAELLEMRQGVTPGGCLPIFLMDDKKAEHLGLETELVHKAIKSKHLSRWKMTWEGRVLFYPYHMIGEKSEPAFTILWDEIKDEKLKSRLIQLNLQDALDFDQPIDPREAEIIHNSGVNNESVIKLLRHRVSLGLIKYPAAANYLTQNYETLQSRIFKKKNIREFNRRWYEYLWPRDMGIMLAQPRILSPTLIRQVRFVVDSTGYLSDHACLMIQPTKKTGRTWTEFAKNMGTIAGRRLTPKEILQYCVAFMNSDYAQERLVRGHRPTPKGSYAITEAYLREIPIPAPSDKRTIITIIKLVDELEGDELETSNKRDVDKKEQKLEALVQEAMKT